MKNNLKVNKKVLFNVLFIVVLLTLTFYYVFRNQDPREIMRYVHSANKIYLFFAVILVLCFVCSESVIIHYMMNSLHYQVPLKNCIRYSFIGFFVSYITPSASGGQPAQMYFMRKDKIPLSASTLVLMVVTIAYKFVLLFIGFFTLLFSFRFVMDSISSIWYIILLGVILNIIVIGALILIIFKPSLAKRMIGGIIIWLGRRKLVKNYKKLLVRVLREITKYEHGAAYLKSHSSMFLKVFLITLFQRICLFAVTYLVYRAFGLKGTSLYEVITLQTLIAIAVDNLPLPGGMGATEGLYYVLFRNVFTQAYMVPSLVLSRGLSFYAILAVGGVVTLYSYFKKSYITVMTGPEESGSTKRGEA